MIIYIVGYRCTGKTTVGRLLAGKLKWQFIDTDRQIEQQQGTSISTIVQKEGWSCFRQLEKKALKTISGRQNAVVSTGGGIVLDPENRDVIRKTGTCIWLKASIVTILDRLSRDPASSGTRPRLSSSGLEQETHELIEQRTPLYRQVHSFCLETDVLAPDQCIHHIIRSLKNDGIQIR